MYLQNYNISNTRYNPLAFSPPREVIKHPYGCGQLDSKVLGGFKTPIATLKYNYSLSGVITSREIDNIKQEYKYDLKGQLLEVVGSEKYQYDLAGNILSKTIGDKTTTYTYDKANQLVKSVTNGVTTNYEYDAAGRLVKEGNKTYQYGYLDKILSVQENDKSIANFDYHVDGQIASATQNGATENFLWDGLALIHRGETSFVNEPYITGGNPILSSKDGVMFNDMLGNTLGTKSEKYNSVQMTAFGETDNKDAMFTGKPMIGELGYAFLFRNYRPSVGKWQTSDPLGYPDGWNNFAYVNNGVTSAIDILGLSIWEWSASTALAGLYGIIYWYRTPYAVTPVAPVINRIIPKDIPSGLISLFSENTLKNNSTISGYINSYFSSNLSAFNKNTPDGEYSLAGLSKSVTLNMSSAWGAVVGTSNFSINGNATVSTANNKKFISIDISCNYHDDIDWNSYDEIKAKGYFDEDTPSWVTFLGYLEVTGDVISDKILSANYDINIKWSDSITKELE